MRHVFMSWLWGSIFPHATTLLQALLGLIGNAFDGLVHVVFQLVDYLLKNTLFKTYSLTGGKNDIVATVAGEVWRAMVGLSGGVALASLLWAAFSGHVGSIAGKRTSAMRSTWGDTADGLVIYVLTIVGGYAFLSMLLGVANTMTTSLFNASSSLSQSIQNPALGATLGIAVLILLYFFLPLTLLLMAGLIIWVVAQWLMRIVDLVFYTGLLPVTAALAITGNKNAFQWNWTEAQGAVFSQLAMAVAWWIAMLFFQAPFGSTHNLSAHSSSGQIGAYFMHMLLGMAALVLVGKAPQMLQSITGHRSAGVAGLALGMMGASMATRAARGALGMSTGGAFLGQMARGAQSKATDKVGGWANNKSVGEMFSNTALGKGMKGLSSAAMSMAGGAIGGVAQKIGGSSAMQGLRSSVGNVVHSSPELTALTSAGRVVAPHARSMAHTAGAAARSGIGAARTAASMTYQPRVTMGRQTELSYGSQSAAEAGISDRRNAAAAGALGVDRAAKVARMEPGKMQEIVSTPPASETFDRVARHMRQPKSPQTAPQAVQEQAPKMAKMYAKRPPNGNYF